MRKLLLVSVFCAGIMSVSANAFETEAKYAYLLDAETGYVMLDKDSNVPMPPASMSKLMTAYMIFDALKQGKITMEDEFTVSENAWKKGGIKSGSSTMFLNPGDKVKVKDLLRGIIVQSGNDACIVAAEGLAGDEGVFSAMATEKAKQLGLTNSMLKNATGLPDPEHLMSSKDLAILANALIRDFPEYYPIYSEKEFKYNGIKQGNRNPLLYTMNGADGLKTGHTSVSGFGLTGSVKANDGRRLIMVINGLKSMNARAEESRKVMGYGLANFENVTLFNTEKTIEQIPVWHGMEQTVPAVAGEKVIMTVERGNKAGITSKIVYDTPVVAPVEKGQKLGVLTITLPDGRTKITNLVAANSVEKIGYFGKLKLIVSSWFGK